MRPPDLEELIDGEVEPAERERLRQVHELLVAAGPPPELSPELENGPDLLATYRHGRRRRGIVRRAVVVAAAAAVIGGAFLGGYISGNDSTVPQAFPAERTIAMHGTSAAPNALAAIRLGVRDRGGNWPMRLVASGLPKLANGGYYELLLTRHGNPVAPCGSFLAHDGRTVVYLNAPYTLRRFDGWAITRRSNGDRTAGQVVATTAPAVKSS